MSCLNHHLQLSLMLPMTITTNFTSNANMYNKSFSIKKNKLLELNMFK
jgi:hypothetical protein